MAALQNGTVHFKKKTSVPNADVGWSRIYVGSDGNIYNKDENGAVAKLVSSTEVEAISAYLNSTKQNTISISGSNGISVTKQNANSWTVSLTGDSLYHSNYIVSGSIDGSTTPVIVGAISGSSNRIQKLDCSDSSTNVAPIGFLAEARTDGQTANKLIFTGELTFPTNTFTPGLNVYCSPTIQGGVTQVKPTQIGQWIVPLGVAKTDRILNINIDSPFLIEAVENPPQDQAIYFKSPSEFSNLTVNVGDILVLNDSVESHPNLATTGNYITYRCIIQYVGDGNAITGGELLSNFAPIGTQPKKTNPISFLDVSSSGLGQNGLVITPGELVVIDDSILNSKIIPGNNLSSYPTLVCVAPVTGNGTSISRSTLENNFRLLTDKKFKRTTTTNNGTSSVSIDLSSTSYEAYHITVKVIADGSTGYKFFATYQFGMTGEPIGLGGCTIQGSITQTILYNPLAELNVTFSDPGDTLQITFDSTGRTGETYSWSAWVEVERL